MATFTELREAIAANLSTIPGVQVSPYILANPTPPSIHVVPGRVDYHQASVDGLVVVTFTVQAFVGAVTDIGSQKRLDRLIAPSGDESVKAAVEADATLGGLCDDLIVTEMTGYQVSTVQRNDVPVEVVGASWTVQVFD